MAPGFNPNILQKRCKYCRELLVFHRVEVPSNAFAKPGLLTTLCPHCDVWPLKRAA